VICWTLSLQTSWSIPSLTFRLWSRKELGKPAWEQPAPSETEGWKVAEFQAVPAGKRESSNLLIGKRIVQAHENTVNPFQTFFGSVTEQVKAWPTPRRFTDLADSSPLKKTEL